MGQSTHREPGATLAAKAGMDSISATSSCITPTVVSVTTRCLTAHSSIHQGMRHKTQSQSNNMFLKACVFMHSRCHSTLILAAAGPSGCLSASGSNAASLLMEPCSAATSHSPSCQCCLMTTRCLPFKSGHAPSCNRKRLLNEKCNASQPCMQGAGSAILVLGYHRNCCRTFQALRTSGSMFCRRVARSRRRATHGSPSVTSKVSPRPQSQLLSQLGDGRMTRPSLLYTRANPHSQCQASPG